MEIERERESERERERGAVSKITRRLKKTPSQFRNWRLAEIRNLCLRKRRNKRKRKDEENEWEEQ